MIIDVKINNTSWVDINALSGISVGSSMILANKSVPSVLVQVSETEPLPNNQEGVLFTDVMEIPEGNNRVWMKSSGVVSGVVTVQDTQQVIPFIGKSVPTVTKTLLQSNIEKGLQFSYTVEMELANNEVKYLSVTTPDNDNSLVFTSRVINTDGGMRYQPFVGGTWTNDNNPQPIINLNSTSTNTSQGVIDTVDPANVVSEGFSFDVDRSPVGKGSNTAGGIFAEGGTERILERDTEYLLKFKNLENSSIYIVFSVSWFEGIIAT